MEVCSLFLNFQIPVAFTGMFSINAQMLISFLLGSATNFLSLASVLNKKTNFAALLTIIQSSDHLVVILLCFVSASTSRHKCAICIYPKITGRVLHLH